MVKGRPRKFDKESALDTALKLFWAHGYEGTSISMLAAAMGINIPSIYAAFGNKEGLFLKAIERYGEVNGRMYHEALQKKTARAVAQSILEAEVELVTRQTCPEGCLMVQGALATSPESDNIRQIMADMRATAEGWMKDRFEQAKKEGDLPADTDCAALACYVMTVNAGLAVQAKSGVKKEQLKRVVKLAMTNWPDGA